MTISGRTMDFEHGGQRRMATLYEVLLRDQEFRRWPAHVELELVAIEIHFDSKDGRHLGAC